MHYSIPSFGATLGLASILLCAGCGAPPPVKHKSTGPKFSKWGSYEGKNFEPVTAIVKGVDAKAGVVTITGKGRNTLQVGPKTRIMHNGTDITLAELPVNSRIKYTLSEDGQEALTIWYGHTLNEAQPRPAATPSRERTSLF